MKNITILLKPVSSLCNMHCKYCFYAEISSIREIKNYGIMSKEGAERIIENALMDLDQGDSLTFAFQGGEPTLAGLPFFEHFVEKVNIHKKNIHVSYSLQTNGLLIDERWCNFFRKQHFLIGLSIDVSAGLHDENRLDNSNKGTFARVANAKEIMDQYHVEYNVLTVLTNKLAQYPQESWNFIVENGISFIQFVPCLGRLEKDKVAAWELSPMRFYSFYRSMFQFWKDKIDKRNYVSIKLFDDIINFFVLQKITSCGINGKCGLQFVVEADGSVYPCDFYVLDQYRAGNLINENISQVFQKLIRSGFIADQRKMPDACLLCEYFLVCNGGCKRMGENMYVDKDGVFCGYRHLLDNIGEELCYLGKNLINKEY